MGFVVLLLVLCWAVVLVREEGKGDGDDGVRLTIIRAASLLLKGFKVNRED